METRNLKKDSSERTENAESVIELDEVNHEKRKDADLRNNFDSLKS